ncbi:MAG: tetratricopeptide repeat protein, partial [Gemmatimonadetes bacterium]|nr:tetratricopeptide repeat protein [Gemmatimonadota bacterium]
MIRALALVALSALIFLAYAPVRDAEFLNYDDNEYVYANPEVAGGLDFESVEWAFTEAHSSNWHPVTWLAHMLDVELFGVAPEDAGEHHLSNVFIHSLATALLAWLGFVLTGRWWASLLVAALFGLHPLHVESVAWISERKDTLSAALGFATLIAWTGYVRRGGRGRYLLTTVLLALGLMTKPILVAWPLVMLLLEEWPLRRDLSLRHRIVEKLPWFGLVAASAIATIMAQSTTQAVKSVSAVPLVDRLINAIHANVAYLGKLVAPLNLSVIYPHWSSIEGLDGPSGLQTALELALLGLITTLAVWVLRRHGRRMPLVMWGLWLILLLPVIGILQVGDQSMADRYTYLPSIGMFTIFVAALLWPVDHDPRSRPVGVAIAALLLVACTIGTWQRAQVWQNSETLFAAAVEAEPMSATAHMNLGQALSRRGAVQEAVRHYAIAASLKPGSATAHFNLGNSLRDTGRLEDAIAEYETALRAQPEYAAAANNLGDVYARQQRFDDAIQWFRRAVDLDPDLAAAHINLARALLIVGRHDEAVAAAERAVNLKPA